MAMLRTVVGAAVALLVVMAMVLEAQAQPQCPSAASYIACQNEVTKENVEPSLACCNKLKAVLEGPNGPFCLCEAMTSSTAQAFHVIKEAALGLPAKCEKLMGLHYVKNYNCGGSIVH